MSLSKKHIFLAGVLLVFAFAMTDSVFAINGMRLWAPYQPEEFGGQRRSGDGVYGEITALLWKLDGPRTTPVFADAMNVEVDSSFRLGTRLIFGNQRGHHGWRFTGVGLSGLGGSVDKTGTLDWSENGTGHYTDYYVETFTDIFGSQTRLVPYDVYYDWRNVKETGALIYGSKSKYIDLDLAWTYRPHPLSWGELEFFAGAKFRDLEDRLYTTDQTVSNLYIYNISRLTSSGTTTVIDDSNTELDPLRISYLYEKSFEVKNRMVGPNLGFNLSRRNRRWTFGAGTSVFLGVNAQSYTFYEASQSSMNSQNVGTNNQQSQNNEASSLTEDDLRALAAEVSQSYAVGTTRYNTHRTVFSPGVTLQLSAKWQWTDAVGVKFGFESTLMDNVARGGDLIATPIDYLDSKGDVTKREYKYSFSDGHTVLLYGFSLGLEVRR